MATTKKKHYFLIKFYPKIVYKMENIYWLEETFDESLKNIFIKLV